MTRADEFTDEGRADPAAGAGDKHLHDNLHP
jgi:hypothetical protein